MIVVICPGIHPPELTKEFVAALEQAISVETDAVEGLQLWVLPSEIAPYGPDLIHRYLIDRWQTSELSFDHPTVWIGFSAGVVGAVATARRWQREGGQVGGLIAVDGWGVPLGDAFGSLRRNCFPRFRLGHDRFTAQSCEWLGASDGYFYCDPAVGHLQLWRSPQQSWGHWQPNRNSPFELEFGALGDRQLINAAQLIAQLLSLLAQRGRL